MKKTAKILSRIICLSFALSVLGLTQESATRTPERVILHAGKLLDVRRGKILTDQAVVIEGNKIVSVG